MYTCVCVGVCVCTMYVVRLGGWQDMRLLYTINTCHPHPDIRGHKHCTGDIE